MSSFVNFLDDNIVFKYIEFQPIEFNENRVQGNDPIAANITAVLAYYANIIVKEVDNWRIISGIKNRTSRLHSKFSLINIIT